MKKPIIEEEGLRFDCDECIELLHILSEKQPNEIYDVTFVTVSGKRMGPYKAKLEKQNKGLTANIK